MPYQRIAVRLKVAVANQACAQTFIMIDVSKVVAQHLLPLVEGTDVVLPLEVRLPVRICPLEKRSFVCRRHAIVRHLQLMGRVFFVRDLAHPNGTLIVPQLSAIPPAHQLPTRIWRAYLPTCTRLNFVKDRDAVQVDTAQAVVQV